ncbi:MAG: glycosyltransferase family 2 protein [Actinobacteria bacterium]|nr:glycosyltransferase family 2 protein [Actinomycetota bacterium]
MPNTEERGANQPMGVDVPRIVTLIAVHDRRETTLQCLRSLLHTQQPFHGQLFVVLVDDGSTDGTGDAVRRDFPEVDIVQGSGQLYWAAAMALAEQRALSLRPDMLLWLNDDVVLDPDALARILHVHAAYPDAIIVGSTRHPDSGAVTFGARGRVDRHPQRFRSLPESREPEDVDAFNGNIVLVPRCAHDLVGTIDGGFAHAQADDDYSLRAAAAGVHMITCPGTQGTCAPTLPRPVPEGSPLVVWRALQQPTARPWRGQLRYLRRHAGVRWPYYLAASYVRPLWAGSRHWRPGKDL